MNILNTHILFGIFILGAGLVSDKEIREFLILMCLVGHHKTILVVINTATHDSILNVCTIQSLRYGEGEIFEKVTH